MKNSMAKFVVSLLAGLASLVCPAFQACAASVPMIAPSVREELVIRNNILKLWGMNWTESRVLDAEELSRMTMLFLDIACRDTLAEDRSLFPQRFEGKPSLYTFYFPRAIADRAAYNIFGGQLDSARLADGIFQDKDGYFVDRSLLYAQTGSVLRDMEKNDEPRFLAITATHGGGHTISFEGSMCSFPYDSGDGSVQKASSVASFEVSLSRSSLGGWKIESLKITEGAVH